jgi:transposase-like protein
MRIGLEGLAGLLEEDREVLCGPAGRPDPERKAYRYGQTQGRLVFGGRKILVDKPRVRSVDDRELALPTWELFRNEDPLNEHVFRQLVRGVSSRDYAGGLEPVAESCEVRTTSRSEVSRRLVARTQQSVEKFLNRSLADEEFRVVMLDGTYLGDHVLVVALGIDAQGKKRVLGLVEGTTESEETSKTLLKGLVDRGLVVEHARLFVIDGGKGLRKAVRSVFGSWALIQRCQIHKLRNVAEHLPESRRAWCRNVMRRAWKQTDASRAKRDLQQLAAQLENLSPSASRSLLEGLDETLTVMSLGLGESLTRTLCSTNPIENLQGLLKRLARNVKRWRNGKMALRWGATGLECAERRFRRIKGYREMPLLIRALDATRHTNTMDSASKIA